MLKRNFLIISILILLFLGLPIVSGYIGNHTYYLDMFKSMSNWYILLLFVICACIPMLYIILSNNKKFLWLMFCLFLGVYFSGLIFVMFRGDLLGSGLLMIGINCFIVMLLMIYFIIGILALGTFLKSKLLKLSDKTLFDIFLNFGIGLSVFLVLNYVMILFNIFFSLLSWIFFLSLGYYIYIQKAKLLEFEKIIMDLFNQFHVKQTGNNLMKYIGIALIIICLVYFFYGFTLSYIPYPTAWDANHAYLFFPKMWAYNNGYHWNNYGMAAVPYLWLGYIGFWFNLFIPFTNFWISPDTIVVEMNFLSGIYVLLFGLALLKEVLDILPYNKTGKYVSDKEDDSRFDIDKYVSTKGTYDELDETIDRSTFLRYEKNRSKISFYIGWFALLLWLTSGMGAFLIFVDNKTDLGVLALIILALYSGFVFLRKLFEAKSSESENRLYLIISGFLFAIAILAKPTAFLDVVSFGLFITWIWFGILAFVGAFLLIIGILSALQITGVASYISKGKGIISSLLGFVLFGLGVSKQFLAKQFRYFKYLLVWASTILLILVVLKGGYIIYRRVHFNETTSISDIVKGIMFSYEGKVEQQKQETKFAPNRLFATTDNEALYSSSADTGENDIVSSENCSLQSQGLTKEQLYENLKEPPGNNYNEDVGRYVGYGWKQFHKTLWGYIFPKGCFSFDKSARILCENTSIIENADLQGMQDILKQLPQDSKGYELLSGIVSDSVWLDSSKSQEEAKAALITKTDELKNFYQDASVQVRDICIINPDNNNNIPDDCDIYQNDEVSKSQILIYKDIYIPYKYLTPLNITFNWSLQNTSSYYTDIGYVLLIMLIFNVIGLIYGIIRINKILIGISAVTLFGWTIWFLIGGGILWYGIGIIIWTILGFMLYVYYIFDSKYDINRILSIVFICLFSLFGLFQLFMNFIRMSTQGGTGPFLWYKQSNGTITVVNDDLSAVSKIKHNYNWMDVFELQFSHYTKMLDMANSRQDNESMSIAGTYAPYFIKDQDNIDYDLFLNNLWKLFSDGDVCNSYLRMKDKNLKYIVIDPNIATVVMGGGNMSLFDRFFAEINSVSGQIDQDGIITMLAKMAQYGYVDYVSSNNIGAKYGFVLSNTYLRRVLQSTIGGNFSDESLALIRAKLITARFWPSSSGLVPLVRAIMADRIMNGDFISDFADISGKNVDEDKLKDVSAAILNGKITTSDQFDTIVDNLSQDERYILVQYLNLIDSSSNQEQFYSYIDSIINKSMGSSSQIVFLEVN